MLLHPTGQAPPQSTVFPYIRYDNDGPEEDAGGEVT